MIVKRLDRLSSKHYLIAILAFLFVLDGLALWFAAKLDHDRTLERARVVLEKTSISLEERLKRTVIATEAILHGRALRIQEKGIAETISSVKEWERFRSAAQGLPDAGSIWLLDNKGNLLMDSTEYPSQRMNFSEREYFAPQRDKGVELYIGPVVKGKITKKYSFTISHRINGRDGGFLGIVLAAIETNDFTNFLSNINIGEKSTVTVFRTDGAMILRQPMQDEYLGKTFKHLKLFSMPFNEVSSGIYETDAIDSIKRLIAYRKVQGLPLLVATGIPVDSVLKEWRARVKAYSLIAAIAFLALMGLSWLAHRITSREEEEKAKELSDANLVLQSEIAERKRAEEELRESEVLARTLLNLPLDNVVLLMDTDGILIDFNENLPKRLDKKREELIGKCIYDFVPPELAESRREKTKELLETGNPVRFQDRHVGFWYDNVGYPILDEKGNIIKIAIFAYDITELKQAGEHMRHLASFPQLNPNPVLELNTSGEIVYSNSSVQAVLESLGMNKANSMVFLPGDMKGIIESWDGKTEAILIREVTVKDRFFTETVYLSPEFNVARIYAYEITKRKKAENELRLANERLEMAQRAAGAGTWDWNVKTDQVVWSPQLFEIFGLDSQNSVASFDVWNKIIYPEDRETANNRIDKALKERANLINEYRIVRHDNGELRWINALGKGVYDDQGKPLRMTGICLDITDRKKIEGELKKVLDELEKRIEERTAELQQAYDKLTEETIERERLEGQLRHSQKMEAIGTLAGGIAHDFNNILAAIIGFSEMVEEDIPLGKPSVQHVQRVINAASRGRELVQQILAFSRKTEHSRHPVSLSSVTNETVQFMRATIPATIDILLDSGPTSDTILATPVEVQQILMNLVTNASLAMQQHGGILHVSIADVDLEPDSPVLEADMAPGEYLRLVVSDTGTGMTPDVVERIFEPFFTTREVGQGTGMGLAVVYGIVKSLHGNIQVESEQGVGTTFNVFFPKVRTDAIAETLSTEQSPGKRERVLFIDDEEFLVEWGQSLLERLGYEVTAMNDSTEAFETFSSDPSQFDLVITDQTMPGITGLNLAREFLKIRPDIPVILCSGHSDVVTLDTLKEAGITEFLMKPLARQELAEIIRRVLDKEMET